MKTKFEIDNPVIELKNKVIKFTDIYEIAKEAYLRGCRVYKDYNDLDFIVSESGCFHVFIIFDDWENEIEKRQAITNHLNRVDYLNVYFKNEDDIKKINQQLYIKYKINILNFAGVKLMKQNKTNEMEFTENWLDTVLQVAELQKKQKNQLFPNQLDKFPKKLIPTLNFIAEIEKIQLLTNQNI
jgi:hypothetical protein